MTYLPALILWYASGAMRTAWPPPLDWVWFTRPKGWAPKRKVK